MKKTFLTSVMLVAAVFAATSMFNDAAIASCPMKSDCAPNIQDNKLPENCMKPMTPAEHAKMLEAKKAEFEARLKLTDEQKAKLEKIKADEKKALKKCRKQMKKEHQKLDKLIAKEMQTRAENVKKFEAILTESQKEEMKKMHEEMKAEREKFAPPEFCGAKCKCNKGHGQIKHDFERGVHQRPEHGPHAGEPHHGPEGMPHQGQDGMPPQRPDFEK